MVQLFKPMRSKKGEMVMSKATIAITVALFLLIAVLIVATFSSSINRSAFSTAQNETFDAVETNTNSGLQLGSNIPLILFAAVIIGAIVVFGSRKN